MNLANYGIADLGLIGLAFLGWWFGVIAAIVARQVRYVVWAFWWAGLMWWFAVLITPEQVTQQFFLSIMIPWALVLAAWPMREAYRRLYLAE